MSNTAAGISGLLLHEGGNFMQLLEGPEKAIKALMVKISRDPRHEGIITLLQGPLKEREFPEWSMAFREISSPETRALPGFSEFLNLPLDSSEFKSNPSRSLRLLLNFKEKLR